MDAYQHTGQLSIEQFYSPFGGKLDPNNRWVLLYKLIPWIQLFIGLSGYQPLPPFDASMMVHFRKRIGPELIKVCNDTTKANGIAMIQEMLATCEQEEGTAAGDHKQLAAIEEELGVKPASLDLGSNWGTLILDATCVPDDIPYPVDLQLLAESQDTTERVIDDLFKQLQGLASPQVM